MIKVVTIFIVSTLVFLWKQNLLITAKKPAKT